jgi:Zn-dependent metalloprotease
MGDLFCIVPPHMLKEIANRGSPAQRQWAWRALSLSEQIRGQRRALAAFGPRAVTPAGRKQRTIYDARGRTSLPGRIVRTEGEPATKDRAVDEAYSGSGSTYDLFFKVYGRNSIDERGMRLDSTVHYGRQYDNAFWNGQQMVYGDGDGELFRRFTIAVDVIGHELTHGVTQFEANLDYEGEPGALNESFSDVFGSLVKQYRRRQTAEEADWLIGKGLFTRRVKGQALRSLKEPGTAYDDPILGKDPQPGHMRDYVKTDEDNGGVHINSGIPNRAFYETAIRIGGRAWERAGRIWYVTLRDRLRPRSTFRDAARLTVATARELFGKGSLEERAVREGWKEVGLRV